jgi:predicted hotdog family 3-hydroxylacyl-ACP dehydratase
MMGRDDIEAIVPHKGAMCLWDEVVDWQDDRIRLRTRSHRDPAHPLRSDGVLRAVHLGEYGAQAMAVHGGLLAQQHGEIAAPGLLVSLRQVELRCARVDTLPGDLITSAERLHGDGSSWQYAFRVHHDDTLLASGRAAVMLRAPPSP